MKTLILNADGRPLSVISFKRAVVLEIKKKSTITALCYYESKLTSSSGNIKIPAVMIYSKFVNVSYKRSPSRRAIRIRDGNKCGYCNIFLSTDDFTVDHIIPVCRFKNKFQANTWENQVSCCKRCNLKKGNRTPDEAGMNLLFIPKKVDMLFLLEYFPPPKEWQKYI